MRSYFINEMQVLNDYLKVN